MRAHIADAVTLLRHSIGRRRLSVSKPKTPQRSAILERFVVRRRGQQWISGSADSERRPVTHRQTSTFSLQFGVVSIDYSDLASLLVPASDTPPVARTSNTSPRFLAIEL